MDGCEAIRAGDSSLIRHHQKSHGWPKKRKRAVKEREEATRTSTSGGELPISFPVADVLTVSRLGPKYQVQVSPYDSNPYKNPPRGEDLNFLTCLISNLLLDEERGLDNNATVEVLSSLSTLTDAESKDLRRLLE